MASPVEPRMTGNFLVVNGAVSPPSPAVPPAVDFLRHLAGAYTTTRTHGGGAAILFWRRHLLRLSNSVNILARSSPRLLGSPLSGAAPISHSDICAVADESLRAVLPLALRTRDGGPGELALTAVVSGDPSAPRGFDFYLHISLCSPPVYGAAGGGARLAMVGPGREVATAKHSEWVSIRRRLEKLRGPMVTEMLLSDDGDRILEGSVTNFFVVCRKEVNADEQSQVRSDWPFEVQTAPISDGVLPGVIRQLVVEICLSEGIPFREVAPSWSNRELWEEAFLTNSLRLVQHVEMIQAPSSWEGLHLKTWKEVLWEEKKFQGLGSITTKLQKKIMEMADIEGRSTITLR